MRSSLRSVTSLALASLLTTALVWGCAQSGGDDLTPDVDPSLAEVDASWAPAPGSSSQKVPDAGKRDTGSDASTKAPVDAGPSNQEPPPPPPSVAKPTQGEVLITEVMYDPVGSEPDEEWIEIYNDAGATRALGGLTIVDGGNRTHVIAAGVTIDPGAYVVLARNKAVATAAKVPAAAIIYEYGTGSASGSGVQLANGATGGVFLRDGATTIAQADYGGWFSQSGGSSVQLETTTYAASGQSASWCLSQKPWATGSDKGTPGAPSDCP